MSAPTRLVTADELLHMPDDGYKNELVEGRLIRMPPPGFSHGLIAARFAGALLQFVDVRRLGAVAVETGYKLARDPDTVRGPDVSFVRRERIEATGKPRGYWSGPPDLAVEVLSPDDRPSEMTRKVREYLTHGVRMVWVIEPDDRTVTVHQPHVDPVTLTREQELDGGDVVPGFRCAVSRLFD